MFNPEEEFYKLIEESRSIDRTMNNDSNNNTHRYTYDRNMYTGDVKKLSDKLKKYKAQSNGNDSDFVDTDITDTEKQLAFNRDRARANKDLSTKQFIRDKTGLPLSDINLSRTNYAGYFHKGKFYPNINTKKPGKYLHMQREKNEAERKKRLNGMVLNKK